MVKNLIGWICLGIFLTACEQEERYYTGESGHRRFSIPLSLTSDVRMQQGTDYVPMATKSEDAIKTKIENTCQCLVLKEVESKWYIEDLLRITLDKSKPSYLAREVTSDGIIGAIELILSPGHYRILVVANASGVKWNPDLTPGYPVKDETVAGGEVPYAFTYHVESNSIYLNKGYRFLSKEIFTGTYQFTISKTGDLHSDPINGNGKLSLTRKVSRFRILLKEGASPVNEFIFENTAHYAFPTLKATGDTPFCDGVDCWGDAYYNRQQPLYELPICISTPGRTNVATNGASYQMVLPENSTYPGVFIFTDEMKTEGIPYEISIEKIFGSSGGFSYYYEGTIGGHTLYPNSIDGLVFRTADGHKDAPGVKLSIQVEQVSDENAIELFNPFYEVNQP